MPEAWPVGRCGTVALAGRPNVGKSTFINQVLQYHLTAVSPQPQTTRRRWRGILSDAESQIVFIDTPGIHEGKTRLGEQMMTTVKESLSDTDLILCFADPSRRPGTEDRLAAERVAAAGQKTALLLNKSDITSDQQRNATRALFLEVLGEATPTFEISALSGENIDPVMDFVRNSLPTGPFFYPPDQVTDAFERDIGSEVIREAVLVHLHEEVPHAVAVEIELWKESPTELKISAILFVERQSQKGIVIGRDGEKLKQIQRDAVERLREWMGLRINLKLYVKVANEWRDDSRFLQEHGLA